ncbi:MAG: hypothetical protein AAF772_16945, partial [Acidobacteriota bacterium]
QLLEDPSMLRESLARWKDRDIAHGRELGKQEGLALGEQKGLALGEQKGLALGEQKGLARGKQEGLEAGRQLLRDVLVDLLETRFDAAIPAAMRRHLDDATPEQLRAWSARAIRVDSLDEVFRDA